MWPIFVLCGLNNLESQGGPLKGARKEGVGLEENIGTRFSLCEQRASSVVRVWKQSVESMPTVLVELNKLHHKALPCKQLLFSNTVTTT